MIKSSRYVQDWHIYANPKFIQYYLPLYTEKYNNEKLDISKFDAIWPSKTVLDKTIKQSTGKTATTSACFKNPKMCTG